ncbi:FecR family protein [Chitinophaga flava]|uniref:FecR protein domain-containing protein n=1 Tax=Chitinophaga flava TaxID=2259036 RepID=A0A365Y2D4_9BACT|nr:FecR family protein [Chitinophaga flava]RBL92411.1 hypothetical protein DF182_07465 [Chitinophaga flava]
MTPQKYPGAQALLEKFHAGKCSPEELEILDRWYNGLGEGTPDLSALEADLLREQFLASFRNALPPAIMPWWRRPGIRWSAAASILLLAGTAWLWKGSPARISGSLAQNGMVTITNNTTGIKQVTLPDSSHIWLNAYATVSWKKDFNQHERSITLTGEGFFDVHASDKHPFIIHTRDMAIRVLGTQFNVEAYAAEKTTRVSLLQGKVQVEARKNKSVATVLKPGYAAAYNSGETLMHVSETDAAKVAAWKDGAFTATDIPLKDAVTRLCDRHGYSVKWKNTTDIQKNITVIFKTDSFTRMLDNLCYISRKQYKISDREVTIF